MDKYYSQLEISHTNDISQVRKAYLKCSLKYHPDKNNGSEESIEKFKIIKEAYDFLIKYLNPENDSNTFSSTDFFYEEHHDFSEMSEKFREFLEKLVEEEEEIYQRYINRIILMAEKGDKLSQDKCDLFGHKFNRTSIEIPIIKLPSRTSVDPNMVNKNKSSNNQKKTTCQKYNYIH